MARRSLIWKIPLTLSVIVLVLLILLLSAVASVLYAPSVRTATLRKGIEIANAKTDYDISLSRIYLSPLHHSPVLLYRAYKGKSDLPVRVEIDSLFVGHRGVDTLVYVRSLRLFALARTAQSPIADNPLPIIRVDTLRLEQTTFHSDSLIPAVGVDAIVGHLLAFSPELNIREGRYPLYGLRLNDVYCGIDLRGTPPPDTIVTEPKPVPLSFELPDGELRNIHFRLTPLGMDIRTGSLDANALVDVGANRYDARRIDVGNFVFSLANLRIPADTVYGAACADIAHGLITSPGLHVRSSEIGATADLSSTQMDLQTMQVQAVGDADFRGSKASLRAFYDIDDERYDASVHIDRVDLSPLLRDSAHIVLAGDIEAQGKGVNPRKPMRSQLNLHLRDAIYEDINVSGMQLDASLENGILDGTLHLPVDMTMNDLQFRGQTDHRFRVSELFAKGNGPLIRPEKMGVDYHTRMHGVQARVAQRTIKADSLCLDFATDTATSLALHTPGLRADIQSPMHVMRLVASIPPLLQAVSDSANIAAITSLQDLTVIDSIRPLIPALDADITLRKGSPLQAFIDSIGVDINKAALALRSDTTRTRLRLKAATNDHSQTAEARLPLRLPAAKATLDVQMEEGVTTASVDLASKLTDGAMPMRELKTDANLWLDLKRDGNELNGIGCLALDELAYDTILLGSRTVDLTLLPSAKYAHAVKAGVRLDDIPLDLVDSILKIKDIDLSGAVRAQASADGLPCNLDLSANVLPLDVAAQYKPYGVGLSLGRTPIIMEHNKLDLNGLPVYGADSTFIALNGGLDLDSMRLNVVLAADSFAPVKLDKGGPLPVYGDLATDIRGTVSGPLDSIVADVDVSILPATDITYPIDKKNLAQVKPYGTVNVRYGMKDSVPLNLGGQINVDHGTLRYSPKAYPVMPFKVDSGSNISFHGPVGQTRLDVSASQKVKADVESKGAGARRVNFNTGVRVKGELDSIGIKSIGFFLEAPGDEAVSKELASADEGTREGLAAMLLATGMYLGQSNEAAQREGYALSSIVNSRINAAISNSKMGKFMEVDFSSGKKNTNITLSKSFLKNKLRLTIGSTISDNPEENETKGLLSSITADYKLTKDGNVSLRLYSRRDKNNVLEGELYKSGLGVRAFKEWKKQEPFRGDTIARTHGITADAGLVYRSNNSLGPDASLKYSLKNVLGKGETFSLKGNGAYYWALRNRHPGDPKKTDTYKLGANASLVFPYLHWAGDNNPDGDTRYMLGYQYENIAGGYGVHKFTGSFTYFIHSPNSPYITHAFTPFSLSVVKMKAESEDLLDKAAEYPQLIKVIAGDEFVPSIGYNFTYNDYRDKRAVNTFLDLGVKESGNLINAIYCAFGHKWSELDKPLGKISFNQFIKLSAELRNKFNLTDQVSIATRLFAGANIPLGNSYFAPLSEAFYAGGPLGMRAATPYAYGPGNFYSAKYNQNFFHAGDVKLEANFELRFPIVWKLYGAAFVDAGNVWSWYSTVDLFKAAGYEDYLTRLEIPDNLYDGLYNNPEFAKQIALGTGAGLRLDLDGLVIRLDLGVGIHAPYQTFKYDKEGKPDKAQPINTYFNIPSALDALRLNFGIGYPF